MNRIAGFDNVGHHVLMDLVAERIKDRKVLRPVSAFLRAGVVELRARPVRPGAAPIRPAWRAEPPQHPAHHLPCLTKAQVMGVHPASKPA